ncbi:hypothetical protein pb186bvf_004367 [Paramecium bursaria]
MNKEKHQLFWMKIIYKFIVFISSQMQSEANNFLNTMHHLLLRLFKKIQVIANQIDRTLTEMENSRNLIKIKEALLIQSYSQQNNDSNKQFLEDLLKIPSNYHYMDFIDISLTCKVCKIENKSIYDLFEHIRKSHSSQESILNQSQFQNQQQMDLQDQEFKSESKSQNSTYKICLKIFKHPFGLFMHQKNQHGQRNKTLRVEKKNYFKQRMFQKNNEFIQTGFQRSQDSKLL